MTNSRASLDISKERSSRDSFRYPLKQNSPCRGLTFAEQLLLALYVCVPAFDFKGKPGGSPAQYIIVAICLFAGALLFASTGGTCRLRRLEQCVIFWFVFLAAAAITSFINQVPFGDFGRVFLPFFLFGASLLVVRALACGNVHPAALSKYCLAMSAISSIWTFFYGITFRHPDLSSMRFEIVSPLLYYLACFGLAEVLIFRRHIVAACFSLLFVLTLLLLSVTRTYVLSLGLAALLIALLAKNQIHRRVWRRRVFLGLAVVAVAAWAALFMAPHLRPNTFRMWGDRFETILTEGVLSDQSMLVRLSEYTEQWNQIRDDPWYLFCGKGMGTVFHWRPGNYPELFTLQSEQTISLGHSLYFNTVYVSGILFGWMVPAILIWAFCLSYSLAKSPDLAQVGEARIVVLSCSFLLAVLFNSFFGHPFIVRELGLFLGLIVGQIAWLAGHKERQSTPAKHAR